MLWMQRRKRCNPHTDNKEENVHIELSYARRGGKLLIKHFTVREGSERRTELCEKRFVGLAYQLHVLWMIRFSICPQLYLTSVEKFTDEV